MTQSKYMYQCVSHIIKKIINLFTSLILLINFKLSKFENQKYWTFYQICNSEHNKTCIFANKKHEKENWFSSLSYKNHTLSIKLYLIGAILD